MTGPDQPPQQPPHQPHQEWGQPWGQQPYGAPGHPAYGGPGAALPPEHPRAGTAMILGIIGLAGLASCQLLLVLGPFAWAIGARAKREIDAEPGRWSGRDRAHLGMVLGIVATALLVLALIAVVAFVALFVAAPGSGMV